MTEISVDIETFSTRPNASIAAIGAASSDGEEFYVVVNDPDGDFDPKTIRWHLAQEEDSAGPANEAVGLQEALRKFSSWLHKRKANEAGEARIWTHATFDMPVLDMAYRRIGKRRPWHYRNCRDLRTLYDLGGGRPTLEEVEHEGKHNALNDARAQLREVSICLARGGE